MTITVGVVTSQGVVVGADSRQSIAYPTGNGGFIARPTTDFGQKVFQLSRYTVCATFGWASLVDRMIEHHLNAFAATIAEDESIDSVIGKMEQQFTSLYQAAIQAGAPSVAAPQSAFGFLVGGRAHDGTFALRRLDIPLGVVIERQSRLGVPQAVWAGNIYPLHRLLNGTDPRIPLPDDVKSQLPGYSYRLDLGESLQEMVDFAVFAMTLTIDTERFTDGIGLESNGLEVCRQPLDIIAVNDDGASWVRRKELRA